MLVSAAPRLAASILSKQLDRIDVECPANATPALEVLHLGKPAVEELVQTRADAALHQQLRVMAPGAFRHRRRNRTQEPHAGRRPARDSARLAQEFEGGIRTARRSTQRRETAERR